jgi:hypothetical protein
VAAAKPNDGLTKLSDVISVRALQIWAQVRPPLFVDNNRVAQPAGSRPDEHSLARLRVMNA